MRATIVLRSGAPVSDMPAVFTVGGYAGITVEGRGFSFDWNESCTSVETDEQGRMVFTSDLKDFEEGDFVEGNREDGVEQSEITAKFITSARLSEVYYECYLVDNEDDQVLIPLDIIKFGLEHFNGVEWDELSFPTEELDRYNRENAIYLSVGECVAAASIEDEDMHQRCA